MNIKKPLAVLFIALAFSACSSGGGGGGPAADNTPVKNKVISLLKEADASSKKGTTIKTLDAEEGTDKDEGALLIALPTLDFNGTWDAANNLSAYITPVDTEFNKTDIVDQTSYAYYMQKPLATQNATVSSTVPAIDGGTVVAKQYDLVAVGGAKAGLNYADFGYWYQEIYFPSALAGDGSPLSVQGKSFVDWDTFYVADNTKYASNITQDLSGATFTGGTLGIAELRNSGNLVDLAPVEGSVSLSLTAVGYTGTMHLNMFDVDNGTIYGNWATLYLSGTYNKTTGKLGNSMSVITGTQRHDAGTKLENFVLRENNGTLTTAGAMDARMLGTAANVEEVAGRYTITGNEVNGNIVTIDGVFGVKK